MKRTAIITFLVLVGCSPSESARAERELALIRNSGGTEDQVCTARRKVADAYLHENNADKYKFADLEAHIACRSADLSHRLGL